MEILEKYRYKVLSQLYEASGKCFPVISSVIEGKQEGTVFVDFKVNPDCAFVVHKTGFCQLIGNLRNNSFAVDLMEEFKEKKLIAPDYLLWYDAPLIIVDKMQEQFGRTIRKRERIRFCYEKSNLNTIIDLNPEIDAIIEPITKENFSSVENLGLKISTRFWVSEDDFLRNGFGVCAKYQQKVVCACYAASNSCDMAEIDVFTHPNYRNKHLAFYVTAKFIAFCHEKGVAPMWDAFKENKSSVVLAEKLGFLEKYQYLFYSFNIPFLKGTVNV